MLTVVSPPVLAEIEFPSSDPTAPVVADAQQATRQQRGSYEVWHLRGACSIQQGDFAAVAPEAVLWVAQPEGSSAETKVILYLEGTQQVPVKVTHGSFGQEVDRKWLGRLSTRASVHLRAPLLPADPNIAAAAYQRGMTARQAERHETIRQAQFDAGAATATPPPGAGVQPVPVVAQPPVATAQARSPIRWSIRGRGNTQPNFTLETRPTPDGEELVGIFNQGGIRATIAGLQATGAPIDQITIEADRFVGWYPQAGLGSLDEITPADAPLEVYLEGNIVFTEGNRVIYADRMYYNLANRQGVVLQAEVLTPLPNFDGLLRLKAEVLRQVDERSFIAHTGAVTTSRLGVPRYWIQSETINFQDNQIPVTDPVTGVPLIDPVTQQPQVEHDLFASSRNNFLYVSGTPVFYLPFVSTNLTQPTYYLDNISIKSDSVFGTQVLVDFNAYQVLGIDNPPAGTEWTFSNDYLSERGPAAGTRFNYNRGPAEGIAWPHYGELDVWGINDQGLDNLGRDRRAVPLEDNLRGRVFWQHRHRLPGNWQLSAEVGYISDRNFLEQYFENEWDQWKDQITGVELKHILNNNSFSISADVRLNDFVTQTESLPRADYFAIGRSLFGRVTYFSHSHVGYARLRTAELPDPADQPMQVPLPHETDPTTGLQYDERVGLRAASRHELDYPFYLGPVKLVLYGLGEVAHWQEDRAAEEVTRLYGQTGIRSSMPLWSANPGIQSTLLNLNGLSHKIVLHSDFFFADANEDLSRLALYDPLNDDAIEQFERMFIPTTFGGARPLTFDPRTFALRSATQSWVTGPTEIADDLMVAHIGVRQRLQTKRGAAGRERLVDWVTLDVGASVFPDASRDNFGSEIGLLNYDFRWHLGDRLALLSDGFADVFGDGMRKLTVGGLISRPGVGNAYLGVRSIEGPISSNIFAGSLNYRMSEKWIVTAAGALDLGPTGNIGQTLSFTRIGESFLIRVGFSADVSRDNIGFVFGIQPRFLSGSKLHLLGGESIPPVGAYRLD